MTHKDAAGSITGFRGLFSYVGAAMAGVPVIMVKNSWAWSGVYIYAVIAILLTTLSLALLSEAASVITFWRQRQNAAVASLCQKR